MDTTFYLFFSVMTSSRHEHVFMYICIGVDVYTFLLPTVSLTVYQSRVLSYIYPIRPYDRSVALVPVRRSRPVERGPVLLCPPFSVFPPLATVGFQWKVENRVRRHSRKVILIGWAGLSHKH